jgi:hypothetical protein
LVSAAAVAMVRDERYRTPVRHTCERGVQVSCWAWLTGYGPPVVSEPADAFSPFLQHWLQSGYPISQWESSRPQLPSAPGPCWTGIW